MVEKSKPKVAKVAGAPKAAAKEKSPGTKAYNKAYQNAYDKSIRRDGDKEKAREAGKAAGQAARRLLSP